MDTKHTGGEKVKRIKNDDKPNTAIFTQENIDLMMEFVNKVDLDGKNFIEDKGLKNLLLSCDIEVNNVTGLLMALLGIPDQSPPVKSLKKEILNVIKEKVSNPIPFIPALISIISESGIKTSVINVLSSLTRDSGILKTFGQDAFEGTFWERLILLSQNSFSIDYRTGQVNLVDLTEIRSRKLQNEVTLKRLEIAHPSEAIRKVKELQMRRLSYSILDLCEYQEKN